LFDISDGIFTGGGKINKNQLTSQNGKATTGPTIALGTRIQDIS
jgi:hypothetical protein